MGVVDVQALVDRRGLIEIEALDYGHTVRLRATGVIQGQADPERRTRSVRALEDPEEFFTGLGEQADAEIEDDTWSTRGGTSQGRARKTSRPA